MLAARALCIWLLSSSLWAQTSPDAAVDRYVQAEMQKRHIPGLALLVIRDGETIREQGYGFANLELQVPVKPETIFQSGSMGKQFTATAVMMLVEEGKIATRRSADQVLPRSSRRLDRTLRSAIS